MHSGFWRIAFQSILFMFYFGLHWNKCRKIKCTVLWYRRPAVRQAIAMRQLFLPCSEGLSAAVSQIKAVVVQLFCNLTLNILISDKSCITTWLEFLRRSLFCVFWFMPLCFVAVCTWPSIGSWVITLNPSSKQLPSFISFGMDEMGTCTCLF